MCDDMYLGAETKTPSSIPYVQTERAPTAKELSLWDKAQKLAKRVNLTSYILKNQYRNIILTHKFATKQKITLNEPDLPEIEERMLIAFEEIESLKNIMCEVNQLELGVRMNAAGTDLDIVEPTEKTLGWVLPAVLGAVVIVGIIARWAHLEKEVSEVTAKYNGILRRSDLALCENPDSEQCKKWETAKQTGAYYKRETIIESVKSAVATAGTVAKKGLGVGLALAIPLLIWMYMPRRKEK
jgi:hypothetical protein